MRTIAGALCIAGTLAPLLAEGPAEQLAQITSTQRLNFAPNGTVRVDKSWGDLHIEGWDQPLVEVAVVKSTSYSDDAARLKEKAAPKLDTIKVLAERRSDSELTISTTRATRANWVPPFSKTTRNGVHLEYIIHVPKLSHLVVNHRGGSVEVANITGEIEVANRDGDILLMLPASGAYAIDARSNMGHIASDFEGRTVSRYLVGQRFSSASSPGSHRIHLRAGFWGITILALPPDGELLSAAGVE